MEDEQEDLRDVVLEELIRLGVEESTSGKKSNHSHKVLNNNMGKFNKNRGKARRSPHSPNTRAHNDRKNTPKSPFASSKRRAEQRRQQQLNKENKTRVFGRSVSEQPCTVVVVEGLEVSVPEFLVDVCALIRRAITTEGIFRKAGSSQRQGDIKRLIDTGNSLPSSVHVVDAACLLKQYLRCLPDPLLSSDIHARLARCLAMPREEDRLEAVVLCTLLLPLTHRHMLIYLMDFFSDVIDASGSNLMDARNLSIVLAPNLLPSTLSSPFSRRKSSGHDHHTHASPDTTLTTNIEIMQMLLECGDVVCRPPSAVCEALQLRLRSRSTEDLLHPNTQSDANPNTRKKRRSASIQRLMTGLRRVVGHSRGESSGSASSPVRTASSSEDLHTSLRLHPGVTLSPMPDTSNTPTISPRKRKSADAFDLGLEFTREQGGCVIPTLLASPSSKRAKLDIEVGKSNFTSTASGVVLPASLLPPLRASVGRARRRSQKRVASPGGGGRGQAITPGRDTIMGHSPPRVSRGSISTPTQNLPLSKRMQVDEGIGSSFGSEMATRTLSKTRSQITTPVSPAPRLPPKRRSCDVPLNVGVKRSSSSFEYEGPVTRRRSAGRRLLQNEPDGADVWTLGPRGVPDGAECNLRDSAIVTSGFTSIDTLEEQYDNIKQAVRSMEEEMDKREVQHLQDTYFSDSGNPVSVQNMSCSDMIQNAYERMKVETKDLGASPAENLSRRLGKELKIRSRRSGEHRVIRSPSERRIGNIRRRSRELVQTISGNQNTIEDTSSQHSSGSSQSTNTSLHGTPVSLLSVPSNSPRSSRHVPDPSCQSPGPSRQTTPGPSRHTSALSRHTPGRSHHTPSLSRHSPSLSRHSPSLSRQSPSLSRHTPSLSRHTPSLSRHTPGNQHTPKLKPVLMTTPLTTSLRRGKPNSVKTGLPLVVRGSRNDIADSPTQFDDACRHILINKRSESDDSQIDKKPKSKPKRRSLQESFSRSTSFDSLNNAIDGIDLSEMNSSSENLSGSFLEQLKGPITRRRSSLLSLSSRLPLLTLSPAPCTSQTHCDIEMVSAPVDERENLKSTTSNIQSFTQEGVEEDFLPASDFKEYLEECEASVSSENMGRPSLAALMKQRKVKANVQLFNNLHCTTPHRRQTRSRCATPQNLPISHRPSSVEQRRVTPRRSQSISHHRNTLTPRELLRARQKSFQVRPNRGDPKVAIVSPLKESRLTNVKPFHGHPSSPSLPPHPIKQSPLSIPAKSAKSSSSVSSDMNPPKLPPRGITGPSPVRVQYR